MSEDRRRYDPFAPHALVGAVAPPVADEATGEQGNEQGDATNYEAMRKADLVDLAKLRGLDSHGSRADIIDRLRS